MNRILFFISLIAILNVQDLHSQSKFQWKETTAAGYKYKYVTNDPAKTRFYTLPSFVGYVGAQADKVNEAIIGMNELLTALPQLQDQFENAKQNILKSIATDRINDDQLIAAYLAAKLKGLNEDPRQRQYIQLQKMSLNDLAVFHKEKLSGKPFTYCVVASDQKVQPKSLEKYGAVKIMSLQEIFGY